MANKKLLSGMLAAALVFGLALAGCENAAQEVEGKVGTTYEKAPQVGTVTVAKTTNKQYYIVSWDAVAENVSYSLLFQQDGKKSSASAGNPQNQYKYDPATGNQIPNDDFDKWSYRVSGLNSLTATPGTYRFGVRTSSPTGATVSTTYSDVKWSEPFTVTAGPRVSAVAATGTTGQVVATWSAVTGAVAYQVSLEINGNYGDNTTVTSATYTAPYYGAGKYRVSVTPIVAPDISVLPGIAVWSNEVTMQ